MGQPIDQNRRDAFLKTLAATGSAREAARAATPWATGPHCGYESFRDLCKRDPQFAADCAEARSQALGKAEAACWSRAVDGWLEPVFRNSKDGPVLCGHVKKFDTILLLRLLGRLDPTWCERKSFDSTVRHEPSDMEGSAVIAARDILRLPLEDQRTLSRLLLQVSELREADPSTPKLIEAASGSDPTSS